jgi:hypothetical protein
MSLSGNEAAIYIPMHVGCYKIADSTIGKTVCYHSKPISDFNVTLLFSLYLVYFLTIEPLYVKFVPCLFTHCPSLPLSLTFATTR